MKVAILHDWLTGHRGGERCLEVFLTLYPEAHIYTLVHLPGTTRDVIDRQVKGVSFLQKIPGIGRNYRFFLPFYPWALRSLDLSGYDLVVSVSHAAVKNIQVPAGIPHICYCLTPMRYVWDQSASYFGALTPLLWPVIKSLRQWDVAGARRPDRFVGISKFVAARIRCFYGRRADVVYPPVDTSWLRSNIDSDVSNHSKGEAFLYAGALVPYKRADLVIEAFNKLGEKLWVVGSGSEEKKLKRRANSNIIFLGGVSDSELANLYSNARALVFPGCEDFGMVPIECMASGRPVIGLYDGALKETVKGLKPWAGNDRTLSYLKGLAYCPLDIKDATGVFIRKSDSDPVGSIISSVRYFLSQEEAFGAVACRKQAELFSPERFKDAWSHIVREVLYGSDQRDLAVGTGL